jgi:hypothetical protein
MAITVTNVGTASVKAATAISVTTAGIPAGSYIFVAVFDNNSSGTIPNTPSAAGGNTWTAGNAASPNNLTANGRATIFYCANSLAIANGTAISVTPRSATGAAMTVFYATGAGTIAPLQPTATTGSSATPSITQGVTPPANSLVIGVIAAQSQTADTFTQATNVAWSARPARTSRRTWWSRAARLSHRPT